MRFGKFEVLPGIALWIVYAIVVDIVFLLFMAMAADSWIVPAVGVALVVITNYPLFLNLRRKIDLAGQKRVRCEIKQIIEMMMTSKDEDTKNKPTFLVHNINNGFFDPYQVRDVRTNGLQADYGDWEGISELIPNRPKGNFFWGEDKVQTENENQVRVEVSDLDTSKLWAFPSVAADAADQLASGHALIGGTAEALLEIEPVNYDDYAGQFHAEWIYTDDIAANLLRIPPPEYGTDFWWGNL